MKTILRIALLLSGLVYFTFAQSTEILKVSIDQNTGNNKPVVIHIEVESDNSISQAVFVELPAGLKPVLKSVNQGDKAFWLIRSKKEITRENVIGWYVKNNGLVLHYKNIFDTNVPLEIELVPDSTRFQRFEKVEVKVYPVSKSGNDLIVQKSVLAQTNISVKKVEKSND